MANYELFRFPDAASLAEAAARRWLDTVTAAQQERRRFGVALSGGRIAGQFFSTLATLAAARSTALAEVDFFWADERCVPASHAESNFALAWQHLLNPLGISPARVHRLLGEVPSGLAAELGEREARQFLSTDAAGRLVFDLVLLGMGEDGHVASLFPKAAPEVKRARTLYVPVIGPKPPPERITLSYVALAAAREVWVLISGAGKETALQKSLSPHGRTPLARVLGSRARTVLFTDTQSLF